jgi:hypothetical protein
MIGEAGRRNKEVAHIIEPISERPSNESHHLL